MTSLLRTTGVRVVDSATSSLEFDEFVPLQFRTFQEPLGAGYLRLGNYSTTLAELVIEPPSQVLRGITVTSIASLSSWPLFSVCTTLEGLPVLATEFEGWKVLDLDQKFSVSARPGEIVVFWGELGECEAYAFDRVRFLIRGGILVGVWFMDLVASEIEQFCLHAQKPEG